MKPSVVMAILPLSWQHRVPSRPPAPLPSPDSPTYRQFNPPLSCESTRVGPVSLSATDGGTAPIPGPVGGFRTIRGCTAGSPILIERAVIWRAHRADSGPALRGLDHVQQEHRHRHR